MTLKLLRMQRLDSSFLGDDDEAAHWLVVLVARRGRLQRQQLQARLGDCVTHIFRRVGIAQAFAKHGAIAKAGLKLLTLEPASPRNENNEPVRGLVIVAEKT